MREMYPLNVGLAPGAEPPRVAASGKTTGGRARDQHLTITEVFFESRRSEACILRCNKSLGYVAGT